MTFSNTFVSMKITASHPHFIEVLLEVQLTVNRHWFRKLLGSKQETRKNVGQMTCKITMLLCFWDPRDKVSRYNASNHDDVIKSKHFPPYWPFVRGIHRSLVNSPHKGQWRETLMFSFVSAWINSWVNNREAGDLRCHHTHHDVIVMWQVTGCSRVAVLGGIISFYEFKQQSHAVWSHIKP